MRVILHIGQSKTGTTALQSFLASNRTPLAKAGICYPDVYRNCFLHHGKHKKMLFIHWNMLTVLHGPLCWYLHSGSACAPQNHIIFIRSNGNYYVTGNFYIVNNLRGTL